MKDFATHDLPVVFIFFLAFYLIGNLIMINLFVAVLLENFEANIADDTFAITEVCYCTHSSHWLFFASSPHPLSNWSAW